METNKNYLKPSECDLGEEWRNYFLELEEVRKGDVFYECERGVNYELKAISDAILTNDGWVCMAKNKKGKVVELFVSGNTEYNAVNFFRTPQHLTKCEEKGCVYFIE